VYLHSEQLIDHFRPDVPGAALASTRQEGLGGQFGGMRTMVPSLFRITNFRGDPSSKTYEEKQEGFGLEDRPRGERGRAW